MQILDVLRDLYNYCIEVSQSSRNRNNVCLDSIIAFLQFKGAPLRSYPLTDLISNLKNSFDEEEIPLDYVEKCCLSLIANDICEGFHLHISEAYAIACVKLFDHISFATLKKKLVCSNLLYPIRTTGGKISEPERIAQVILSELDANNLIVISETGLLHSGTEIQDPDLF